MTDIIAHAQLEPDDLMNLGFLASNLIGGKEGHEIAELADRMACLWRIDRGQLRMRTTHLHYLVGEVLDTTQQRNYEAWARETQDD